MALIAWGEDILADGRRLPWTRVEAGGTRLHFFGRPGPRLLEAVEAAERVERARLDLEASEAARAALWPLDGRD